MMRASMPGDGVLGLDGLRLLHHVVQAGLPGQHLADLVLLGADVVLAHQRRGVAERGVRLVLLLDEAAEHPQVTGERLGLGVEQQRRDLRRVPLAVSVDAAVALLDPDQGPRDVVVDELVALLVQVHALAGQVAGDEHADGRRGLLEALDDVLLLVVGQAAVQDDRLLGGRA